MGEKRENSDREMETLKNIQKKKKKSQWEFQNKKKVETEQAFIRQALQETGHIRKKDMNSKTGKQK